MKEDRKSLMIALFEVKDSGTKPDVTDLPLKSPTRGLKELAPFTVDVLKNVVTLPIPRKENQSQVKHHHTIPS